MLAAIVCADWSKDSARRAAYVADIPARVVRRFGDGPFGLQSLLAAVAKYPGEVLVGVDAPLGAPRSLLVETHRELLVGPAAKFTEWLRSAAVWPDFFSRAVEGAPWSPLRPFFRVSAGIGSLNARFAEMRARGVEPLREVDARTGARSPFILSGIPGSVGSSVADLWPALAGILANQPGSVRVWPFDPRDPEGGPDGVVLAEIYPRALYALALSDDPRSDDTHAVHGRLKLAKSEPRCRHAAIARLIAQPWVRASGVRFEDAAPETMTEDSFDALVSAAALLRCALEGRPLGWSGADAFEGGILALDNLDFTRPERVFRYAPPAPRRARERRRR